MTERLCDTCGLDAAGLRDRCESKDRPWHANNNCGMCFSDVSHLAKDGRCGTCTFWLGQIDTEPERRAVINGTHYRIEPETGGRYPATGAGRGMGGRRVVIRFTDGRHPAAVATTNLWFQGRIPEHLRDRLPDNAVFVPQPLQQLAHRVADQLGIAPEHRDTPAHRG